MNKDDLRRPCETDSFAMTFDKLLALWEFLRNPQPVEVKIKKLNPEAFLPKTWSEHAVGMDLHACIISNTGRPNTTMIPANSSRFISTGLAAECAEGYYLMVCSRSGLAKKSISVTNSPGLIDPDYRGEIGVILYNGSHETFYVKHGDRIAQLVVFPYLAASIIEVSDLTETARGESGLGSTGV